MKTFLNLTTEEEGLLLMECKVAGVIINKVNAGQPFDEEDTTVLLTVLATMYNLGNALMAYNAVSPAGLARFIVMDEAAQANMKNSDITTATEESESETKH